MRTVECVVGLAVATTCAAHADDRLARPYEQAKPFQHAEIDSLRWRRFNAGGRSPLDKGALSRVTVTQTTHLRRAIERLWLRQLELTLACASAIQHTS